MIIKAIPGYPGYFVTDNGVVISTRRRLAHIVKPHRVRGYMHIIISLDGKPKKRSIQGIMLEAFKGPRPEGMHASHIDGVRDNNVISNLMWVTPKENCWHKVLHGTQHYGSQVNGAKLTEPEVLLIKTELANGASLRSLAFKFNVGDSTIGRIKRGINWCHVGADIVMPKYSRRCRKSGTRPNIETAT